MSRPWIWLLGLGGAIAWAIYQNRQTADSLLQSGEDVVSAALSGWQNVQQGPKWVPIINSVEASLGIPANLLARVAYQESHFRPDIITGARASSAGALGILQMMPAYFSSVQVPRPFTDADTLAQINQAGQYLLQQFATFQDWGTALAAYNDGPGNVNAWIAGNRTLPQKTIDYVSGILADVPLAPATVPA